MAYIDNYPGGYKQGYSSADDPDRKPDIDPNYWDRLRMGMGEDPDEAARRYEATRKREEARELKRFMEEKEKIEKARESYDKFLDEQQREQAIQKKKAINLIVQQKKQEYNSKSWFGKAISTLRGKNFDKIKSQVQKEAERRVNSMSPERLESFLEAQEEIRGARR